MLIDVESTKTILRITCTILQNNFFYDTDCIGRFLDIFGEVMTNEIIEFEAWAEDELLETIDNDYMAKFLFTCYFVSLNVRDIFINHLYFTEPELQIFNGYIDKYAGVKC